MKNLLLLILLLVTAQGYADQMKPSGKWFAEERYVEHASHKIALKAAKKWMSEKNSGKKSDYTYQILDKGKTFRVFIQFIDAYSKEGERLSAVGGHVTLHISKSGKIIDVLPGV